jgi:hypothetical protein
MAGNVIQGHFPNGLPRFSHAAAAQPSTTPSWVQQAIGRCAPQHATVQRTIAAPAPQHAVLAPPAFARHAARAGQPLPPAVRQMMEAVFGTSFADVRIHVSPLASAIGAVAFTEGSNIHFAPGQYDPASPRGRQIIGHELAHVVQQRAGRVRNPFGRDVALVQDPALEREAERMSRRAGSMVAQRAATSTAVEFKATSPGEPIRGPLGYFLYRRKWWVKTSQQGVIIQHVQRDFQVHRVINGIPSTVAMTGAEIDTYVTNQVSHAYATVTSYWELWTVDAFGNISDGGDDTFSLCAIMDKNSTAQEDTTSGSYTISGTASFYATTSSPAALGFTQNSVPIAGGLHSCVMPGALPPATAGPVNITLTATWDCTKRVKDTKLT